MAIRSHDRTAAPIATTPPAAPGQSAPTTGFAQTFSSLSNRDFMVLWIGMLASYLAMQMQMVARGFLAFEIGGAATALGIVTLAWGAPQLLLSPLGGVIADRIPKRNLLIYSQSIIGVTTLLNAVLISMGHIEIWHLAVIGMVQGGAFAFNMPARQALIPELVGRDQMANAIAINNAGLNLTRVLGPTFAGVLISLPFFGTAGAFYFMSACYLVVLGTLFMIPAGQVAATAKRGSLATELTAGMRYIWNNPTLLTLVGLAFVPVLLAMPYQSLMPVFAKREFGVGSEGLGLLMGAAGLGALAGSLLVAYFSNSPGKGRIQLAAGALFGVSLVLFAAAPSYVLAVVALLFVGAANNVYMALNNTLILSNCESQMHGRVMSVYMMTFSLMPLTTLPMSAAADIVGSRWTVGVAGLLTALIITGAAWAVPGIRSGARNA